MSKIEEGTFSSLAAAGLIGAGALAHGGANLKAIPQRIHQAITGQAPRRANNVPYWMQQQQQAPTQMAQNKYQQTEAPDDEKNLSTWDYVEKKTGEREAERERLKNFKFPKGFAEGLVDHLLSE